ncbi:MAG: mechanosensitive ion channel [Planctomycetota bacterium]
MDELEALVTAMGAKDEIESSTMRPYKAYLLEQGRVGSLDTDAVVGIVDQWYQKGKTWVVEEGPGILVTIVQFIVILIAFSILSKIAGKIVGRMLRTSRLKVSDLLRSFFVNTATKLVFLFGLVIALGTIGIDVGPLLAAIGVVGFVIGFALQDTLANFASGIMILLYRPYDIGDVIKAAGVLGTVKAMNLVSTTVVTGDNQCEIVPNKSIWGGVITNITANSTRRVDLTIGVGYQDDLQQVKSVIVDILEKHPKILKDPAPVVRLHNLGESSVDFVVRPWCATSDYWAVYWDLHEQIKERLDQEGISIPYPQRDLHLHYVEGHAPAAS